jgi:proteasome lid subunit RPN8/RPN11
MQPVIRIRNDALKRVMEHAAREPQRECCGLLGGRDGAITQAFAATNAAADPAKNYEIAPEELFRLMREMRAGGLVLMGVYHSHPNGNNEPSPRDIERAYYPEAAYFILTAQPRPAPIRAFTIRDGLADELQIVVE